MEALGPRRAGAFRELTGDPSDYTSPASAVAYLIQSALMEYDRGGGDLQHFVVEVSPSRFGPRGTGIRLTGWLDEERTA